VIYFELVGFHSLKVDHDAFHFLSQWGFCSILFLGRVPEIFVIFSPPPPHDKDTLVEHFRISCEGHHTKGMCEGHNETRYDVQTLILKSRKTFFRKDAVVHFVSKGSSPIVVEKRRCAQQNKSKVINSFYIRGR